jgi:hypothetical protein
MAKPVTPFSAVLLFKNSEPVRIGWRQYSSEALGNFDEPDTTATYLVLRAAVVWQGAWSRTKTLSCCCSRSKTGLITLMILNNVL